MTSVTIEGKTRLGKYRVIRELGHGGMALVYLAEDMEAGRVRPLRDSDQELRQRHNAHVGTGALDRRQAMDQVD